MRIRRDHALPEAGGGDYDEAMTDGGRGAGLGATYQRDGASARADASIPPPPKLHDRLGEGGIEEEPFGDAGGKGFGIGGEQAVGVLGLGDEPGAALGGEVAAAYSGGADRGL